MSMLSSGDIAGGFDGRTLPCPLIALPIFRLGAVRGIGCRIDISKHRNRKTGHEWDERLNARPTDDYAARFSNWGTTFNCIAMR